ncbi:MAG: outer membrane protein assembly factor BamA [Kiritimatiellae bacterium]|nr:outer membrane protein assembly factor BamA [Kiritimatiellia bacterium]
MQRVLPLLSAAALVLAAAPAPAVPAAGAPVASVAVDVRGDVPVDESFVLSFSSARPGETVRERDLSADVKALLGSSRFAYVSAAVEERPDGLAVTYVVEGRRRLADDPTFEGRHVFSRDRLKKAANLKAADFVDETVAAAAAARVRELYRGRRHFDATVEARLVPDPAQPGAARLVFAIDEGVRYSVDFLEFPGAKALDPDDLGALAAQHSWFNPQSWVITPRLTDADLDAVAVDARRQYYDAGYLDATVSAPRKSFEGDRMRVAYDVEEGTRYRVGRIRISGATLFPESALRDAIRLRPGDVAGAAALEGARAALRDYYASRGYTATRVSLATTPGTINATMDVSLTVKESALTRVRNVLVRGNTATKDKVIRREIGLNPGDPFDRVQADLSRRRLMGLGYFSDASFTEVAAGEGWADAVYDVVEQPTGQFTFGAGFSSVDHLVGMLGLYQSNFDVFNWRNFRGGGQRARLDVSAGSSSTDVDVSFVEPWFLDRRLALDVDLYLHNRSHREYDERRIGGSVGLEKFFPWVGTLGLYYGLEKVTLDDVATRDYVLADDPSVHYRFTDEDDDYLLGSLRLGWTLDTRDNRFVPRSGTRAVASLSLFNAALGSDYDMYEASFRFYHYEPLPFGLTLALLGQASTIDGTGGDEVPVGSRYFLGGGRQVRGFRNRNLGPKALYADGGLETGDFSPIGGCTKLWGAAEISFPLFSQLRFATFVDAGNVWEDAWDADFGKLGTSCGCGLRLDIPGFPIRLDYAHVLDEPDDYAEKRQFVFWIGVDN